MIHLGMSGKLRIQNNKNNFFRKHDHAELIFNDEKIIFNDVRRFGSIHLTKDYKNHFLIKGLGIEPLSSVFNKNYLLNICEKSNLNIKKLIIVTYTPMPKISFIIIKKSINNHLMNFRSSIN